jgi:hypothetical protein
VVWTRHLAPPDLTPAIRQWFIDAEFKELGFETVANTFGVEPVGLLAGRPNWNQASASSTSSATTDFDR